MALKKASAYLGGLDTNTTAENTVGNGATGDMTTGNGTTVKSTPDKEAEAQASNASAGIASQLPSPAHPTTQRYNDFNDTADTRSENVRTNANTHAKEDLATKQQFGPTDYDPNYYANVAKGEDPDRQLNDRTFESTMHSSRLADYYNNRPQTNVPFAVSSMSGQAETQAAGYTRPQINTQEMRQMRENEKLDEQRKTGRINLQNMVGQVPMQDINTYKNQISANTEAGRNLQNQIIAAMAGAKAGQESSVNTTRFAQELAANIGGRKAQIVMGAISRGDYQMASLLTGIFTGSQTMITPDDFYTGAVQRTAYEIARNTGLPPAYVYSMLINNPAKLSAELADYQMAW
jgi:hypothetical protein